MRATGGTDFSYYYTLLGIDRPASMDVKTLDVLIKAHMRAIPYQNFDIVRETSDVAARAKWDQKLDIDTLLDNLVVKRQGAMCYETSELLYRVLKDLGFDVIKTRAIARVGDKTFSEKPYIHQILIVTIEGKKYIADPGFGYSGLYGALEFDLDKSSEGYLDSRDLYKVERYPNCYRVSSWINHDWFVFYDFDQPIVEVSKEQALLDYQHMITDGRSPICWKYLKPGAMQEVAVSDAAESTMPTRVGFYVSMEKGVWDASMTLFTKKGKEKQTLNDVRAFQEAVKEYLQLNVPDPILSVLASNLATHRSRERHRQFAVLLAGLSLVGTLMFLCTEQAASAAPSFSP